MGAFDQTARRAVKMRPVQFLTWILPRFSAQYRFVEWHDTRTVPFPGEPDRVCDTVAELERIAETEMRWLVDVEMQAEPDAEMLERIGEYALRLRRERRYGSRRQGRYRVASVVINLTGPPQAGVLDMTDDSLDGGHRLQAVTITMRDVDAAATLSSVAQGEIDLCVLPWIPLMQGADEAVIIEQWCELAATETEDRDRRDYPGLALVFADLAGRRYKWNERLEGYGMRESQVVLEWQREAEIKLLRTEIVRLIELRHKVEVPNDLRQIVNDEEDVERLTEWLEATALTDSVDSFRKAIQPSAGLNGA